MPDGKYVLHVDARGGRAQSLDALLNQLDDAGADDVWSDEYNVTRGYDDEAGEEVLSAHIPYDDQETAEGKMGGIMTAIQNILENGPPDDSGNGGEVGQGEIHVHHCPTGGGPDSWSCGDAKTKEETL